MSNSLKATHRFFIIAAILQIVWGIVPSASKYVIDEIPVELYIAIRWSISGTIFALYLTCAKRWRKLLVKDIGWVSLLGIFGYGLGSLGTLYGLKLGGITNFALLGSLGPLISSLVAILILKERPRKLFYLALPIGVLGLIFLTVGKYQVSSWRIAGMSALLIISAYFLEAVVFVFSKKLKSKMSTMEYLAIAQISAAILMWLLQFTTFHQTTMAIQLSLRGLAATIFVSVIACVLCYAILYWLLNYVDGHKLALFDGLHSISASIFGYLLFQEQLRPLILLGGALLLMGLIVGNLPEQQAVRAPHTPNLPQDL